MRIAAKVYPQEGLEIEPGLYVAEIADGLEGVQSALLFRWPDGDWTDDVGLRVTYSPSGEIALWMGELDRYVGPSVTMRVTVAERGNIYDRGDIRLYDGAGGVLKNPYTFAEGSPYTEALLAGIGDAEVPKALRIGTYSLFPGPPSDAPDTSGAGSARMHGHYSGALRAMALAEQSLVVGDIAQLNVNLLRPVHYWGPLYGKPFLGADHKDSTTHGGYSNRGGIGSTLYGASEHYGRPAGVLPSPWEPDDHEHFAVHQWLGYAALTHSHAAAVHAAGMFESLWRLLDKGVFQNARSFGPLLGGLGEALYVYSTLPGWRWYAEHLMTTYIPKVLDKLDAESARAMGHVEWRGNVYYRGGRDDHIEWEQTSWMTGQLVIGLERLMHWLEWYGTQGVGDHDNRKLALPLYKRARKQLLLAIEVLRVHTWAPDKAPYGNGWAEGATPYGALNPSAGKHAIAGKFRRWILPALEVSARWMHGNGHPSFAADCETKANWLALQVVGKNGDWFGSDGGDWPSFLADEGWLTASRLDAWTPEALKARLEEMKP